MTTIKKLRKEALNLIKENISKIDGRSIAKFSDIARTARSEKLQGMIETLKLLKAPLQAIPEGLDDGVNIISTPEEAPKKKNNKRTVSLKDLMKFKQILISLYYHFFSNN